MEQEAQDRLAPELEKLPKPLVAIEEATRAFGLKGWVNKKIQRAKAAKKCRNIDTKIERVVQTINRVVQTINRVLDTVSRGLVLDIQQRIYPTEAAVWSKIDERIAESGGDPMDEATCAKRRTASWRTRRSWQRSRRRTD